MDEYFNAVAHTWQWKASFGALCFVQGVYLYRIIRARIVLKRKRKSFETYRDTGQVDETFDSLSGAGAEAAGRARAAVVGRSMVLNRDFTPATICPYCSYVDNHHIRDVDMIQDSEPTIMYQVITRQCTNCEKEWSQFG